MKFSGIVAYSTQSETTPGVWTNAIEEREYKGDIVRVNRKLQNGSELNDKLTVSNLISVVCDDYAYENFINIHYVIWMGSKFKVNNVELQPPRLLLTLGGVYNAH